MNHKISKSLLLSLCVFSSSVPSEGHIIPWAKTSELLKQKTFYTLTNCKYLLPYENIIESNDELFKIEQSISLKGGGPALGYFGYWLTKTLGYGVPAVIGATTIIATAPAIVTAFGGSTVVATGATFATTLGAEGVAATAATLVGANTAMGTAVSVATANAAITAVGGTTVATQIVGVGVASTTATGGYIAAVETAAIAFSAFLTSLPTP